ncbi:hypothetical protein H920_15007 [Fukomys damarensis]|uniref:Uncharacterized protein n=1 Tax=Fukomys damarensis TaxID=885580 RepID=A0A091CZY2_FUKDA|nr:hypothetical protein H920_15007 [Fukomys damarensis]
MPARPCGPQPALLRLLLVPRGKGHEVDSTRYQLSEERSSSSKDLRGKLPSSAWIKAHCGISVVPSQAMWSSGKGAGALRPHTPGLWTPLDSALPAEPQLLICKVQNSIGSYTAVSSVRRIIVRCLGGRQGSDTEWSIDWLPLRQSRSQNLDTDLEGIWRSKVPNKPSRSQLPLLRNGASRGVHRLVGFAVRMLYPALTRASSLELLFGAGSFQSPDSDFQPNALSVRRLAYGDAVGLLVAETSEKSTYMESIKVLPAEISRNQKDLQSHGDEGRPGDSDPGMKLGLSASREDASFLVLEHIVKISFDCTGFIAHRVFWDCPKVKRLLEPVVPKRARFGGGAETLKGAPVDTGHHHVPHADGKMKTQRRAHFQGEVTPAPQRHLLPPPPCISSCQGLTISRRSTLISPGEDERPDPRKPLTSWTVCTLHLHVAQGEVELDRVRDTDSRVPHAGQCYEQDWSRQHSATQPGHICLHQRLPC